MSSFRYCEIDQNDCALELCILLHFIYLISHQCLQVKVTRSKKFEDKIIITLPANGQRVEIGVSYEPGKSAGLGTGIKEIFYSGVVGLSILTALILAMMYCKFDRVERSVGSQPATPPATPHMTAPLTPERRSSTPGFSNDQSPRTPQPFVDYVRRTIDKTPYYRQEARRMAFTD
ncbi:hypothetical protein Pint_02810 [Pistacia integerrima]|uniref:Uncharacterized protein n=1 Tax=Pistacia integerrima TaxID=434235 RepID=A0ACC0ZN23_9ROSI|nr:hypothetical protein Pint_02810 [Pistacia integerrima]